MKTKAGHQNKFLRIITTPFRALGKAKDMYVRSMTSYANKVGYGTNYMGTTTSTNYATPLPKSFSVNVTRSDDNDDLRELIRAASVRSLAETMDINHLILEQQLIRQQQLLRQQQQQQSKLSSVPAIGLGPKGMPPRSVSVGMAKIDEETPYAAGEDSVKSSKKAQSMYPRSKSYAVNKRTPAAF